MSSKLKQLLKSCPDASLARVVEREDSEKKETIAASEKDISYQLSRKDKDMEVVIRGGEAIVQQGSSVRYYLFDDKGRLLKSIWSASEGDSKEGCFLNREDEMLIQSARKLFEAAISDPDGFKPSEL